MEGQKKHERIKIEDERWKDRRTKNDESTDKEKMETSVQQMKDGAQPICYL